MSRSRLPDIHLPSPQQDAPLESNQLIGSVEGLTQLRDALNRAIQHGWAATSFDDQGTVWKLEILRR